jgi:CO dehydrogenase maturation factor
MRIAFIGKGGSGKTTLAALFCRHLAAQGAPILGIDADINQHLATAIGLLGSEAIPPLGGEIERIKAYLRGTNSRISSPAAMLKTTPPGTGSRLLRVQEDNEIYDHFVFSVDGVRLMVTGPFSEDDLGLKCYHSKVGAVELLLNHLLDDKGEYIVVDMTAGADSFASGLFTRFDLTCAVVEPTLKSLTVYQQYVRYARDHDVRVKVIGNKVEGPDDIDFLREHIGDALLGWFRRSDYVRALEKGRYLPLSELERENNDVLASIRQEVDGCQKDWEKYYRQAIEFHDKNARAWGNGTVGEDLTRQIDPNYSLAVQAAQALQRVPLGS